MLRNGRWRGLRLTLGNWTGTPLRDHECTPRNQRQQNHERPQSRYVRARSRCSSRASLPLTPRLARLLQQLECALPLRFGKDKVS